MKGYIHILGLALLMMIVVPAFADEDCDQALSEAMGLYKSAKYQEAKELFVYVQKTCGTTYGSANTWVQKCNQAIADAQNAGTSSRSQQQSLSSSSKSSSSSSKSSSSSNSSNSSTQSRPQPSSSYPAAYLTLSKTTITVSEYSANEYITVESNRDWEIQFAKGSWYSATRNGNTIKVIINQNTGDKRQDFFNVNTTDGSKSIKVNISQAQATKQNSSSASSSAYLSLSKMSISASAAGTTEYITVTSNRKWEIQHPIGAMYSVSRYSDNMVKVVISKNTSGTSRSDYFNIWTTDGSKTVKVSLSQGISSGSSSSSSYTSSNYNRSSYNSQRYRSNSGYSALSDFNATNGKWEIDWASARVGICTGYEIEVSALAFRYSMLKVEPIVLGVRYDFIRSYETYYYQPDVKLVFPWDSHHAVEFGLGPSFSGAGAWFTTEVGVLCHWKHWCSSDFYMRYDGMFTIGASFNFCTSF